MFELQDSKGNRFRLSRGGQSQEHAALALEGNPLQVKRLLKFCDSIALVRAYSFFFTSSTKQPQTKANPTHAKRHRNTLLITHGDHQKITASGIPKAQRPATRTPSPEERLFKAIASGELQLAHTHKVEAFNVARAEKELGLTRSKLLSDSNALVLEKKRLADRGQQSPWGLIASSEASSVERKALDARSRIIKLNYQRFSASLPNVKKVDGAAQQQNITGPQGSGEIQARDMLKALGFSTTKVTTAQYQRAQQQLEQIWKSKNLYKQAREFSSDYAKTHKNTEKAADKELATYELTLCLLLCHDQPIHALASPAPEQINLFSRYKTLGRGFCKAAETARAIEAERETIAGRATAASFDDLAKESSEERERTTPPATLTFIEITLLDDKGEPVANEAYWVKDPEGNEHTGNLDGNGFARIDNIKPGNCQVAFPEIEGSGISQCRADVDCCTPAEPEAAKNSNAPSQTSPEAAPTNDLSSASNDESVTSEPTTDLLEDVELCCLEANGKPASELPYKATFADGSEATGKLSKEGTAELKGKPAGEVTVIYGEESTDAEISQLRSQIKTLLDQVLVDERQEAKDIEARLQAMGVLERYWEYEKAKMRGVANFTVGLATFVKELGDFTPMQMFNKAASSAWEAWQNTDDSSYIEAFNQSFTDKQFKDLADIIGVDPRTITKQDLANAQAVANFVWDDTDTQKTLLTFAKDYIFAQHSLETAEFGTEMAMELVFDLLITALTLGAGATVVAASKLKHLGKLKKLGALFKKLAAALRKKASVKKAKGNTGTKIQGQLDKPEAVEVKVSPNRDIETPEEPDTPPAKKPLKVYPDAKNVDELIDSELNSFNSLNELEGEEFKRHVLIDYHLDPDFEEITRDEYLSLVVYTTNLYDPINKGMRGKSQPDLEKWSKVAKDADSALAKLAKHENRIYQGEVYRGDNFSPELIEELFPTGGVHTEPAFKSTSNNPDTAFLGNTQLTIKSKSGLSISDVSVKSSENEVLFRPGTRFKVTSKTSDGFVTYITLEEI